ncbi:MAG: ferrous iron transport protein A [Bacteroidota bacterium]|jgi:Fe2+ transport system protein FeoA
MKQLDTCPVGTRCRILAVAGEESCVRRARELGLVEGVCCSVERKAPFHGPVEISTGQSRLGVRLGKELSIIVEVIDAAHQQLMGRTPHGVHAG